MSKTIRIFEHETLRVGQKLRSVDGAESFLTQHHVDALARFNDTHSQRYFRVGYQRIGAQHFVGYVQVGELGIEILPKADRLVAGEDQRLRWRNALLEMLRVATGLRLHSPTSAMQSVARASLMELVAMRFIEEVERLLHDGLVKGYRSEESSSSAFRGRLLVRENLRENLVRADRFFVRYTTFDRDVLVNQVLGAAVAVLGSLPLSSALRARIAVCAERFQDVSTIRVAAATFERITTTRRTERYRSALVFARMILQQHVPELRSGAAPVFALLFDMNVLWERYVAALFKRARVPGVEVSTQEARRFWKAGGNPAKTVRPDIVLRDANTGAAVLVADTKWKVLETPTPADADLKQMFVYNELFGASRSVLIYPGTGSEAHGARGSFVNRGHDCELVQLGLFAPSGISTALVQEEVRTLVARFAPVSGVGSSAKQSEAYGKQAVR